MKYLIFSLHDSLKCTCHCQVYVFSVWSIQVYHYFCRLVYKIYCSGNGGAFITVDYSLSVSTLVLHQTGHLHHLLCCTCHHLTSPPHQGGDHGGEGGHTGGDGGEVTAAGWCGDRSGPDHLTALATRLSSLVLATNNQSSAATTTSPSPAQAHRTPQSRTRPPPDPEHQILAADCCRPGLVWWRPDRVLIWHGAGAGRGRHLATPSPTLHIMCA